MKAEFPPAFMGDFCEIWGCFHRLDTTLIDFTDMKCQRGDLSFIFNGDAAPSESFVVLDNEQKVYQRIHHEVKLWERGWDTSWALLGMYQTKFTSETPKELQNKEFLFQLEPWRWNRILWGKPTLNPDFWLRKSWNGNRLERCALNYDELLLIFPLGSAQVSSGGFSDLFPLLCILLVTLWPAQLITADIIRVWLTGPPVISQVFNYSFIPQSLKQMDYCLWKGCGCWAAASIPLGCFIHINIQD